MLDKLQSVEKRYEQLNELLSTPEIAADINKLRELSKEQASIRAIYEEYKKYAIVLTGLAEAKEILETENDEDFREMAKEEIKHFLTQQEILEQSLRVLLVPKDPNDEKNVIVEIRGAAGGDEANIFCGDLYRMYAKYAEAHKLKMELIEAFESQSGGFSQVSFLLKGRGAYSQLKYESGAHRVQRVPETESQGRIHTSTATVLVMLEIDDEITVVIKDNELKIDVYRSGGAGGQSVNTTDSAVRITHLPTGIIVTCQDGRSQHENKDQAMKVLRAKIYDAQLQKQQQEQAAVRQSKLGRGDRSEKIRTYNYPQNRVTDHRIGLTINQLDRIIEGKLDDIIAALQAEELSEKLQGGE
ncbi:peptide chain release factor RF-1 [Erysipelotrichaceae bacterium]|nr:peptide chain release factor RF-1 [Erysipelotrichaceae bacterium]